MKEWNNIESNVDLSFVVKIVLHQWN